MLTNQMEKTGNFLFRWRTFIPICLIPISILALSESGLYFEDEGPMEILWHIICASVSFAGVFFRFYIVGFSARRTSGRNTKSQVADSLNTTGAYSMVRHPLYLANFLMLCGLVLFTQSWWFLTVFILSYMVYYERIMMAEERFLSDKFGDKYRNWAASVPAFLPNFSNYKKPAGSFSWKKVIRQEYPGILWLVVIGAIIEFATEYFDHNEFELEPEWQIVLGFTITAAIVIKLLKKYTNLLKD